jgi:hypothetical protein
MTSPRRHQIPWRRRSQRGQKHLSIRVIQLRAREYARESVPSSDKNVARSAIGRHKLRRRVAISRRVHTPYGCEFPRGRRIHRYSQYDLLRTKLRRRCCDGVIGQRRYRSRGPGDEARVRIEAQASRQGWVYRV